MFVKRDKRKDVKCGRTRLRIKRARKKKATAWTRQKVFGMKREHNHRTTATHLSICFARPDPDASITVLMTCHQNLSASLVGGGGGGNDVTGQAECRPTHPPPSAPQNPCDTPASVPPSKSMDGVTEPQSGGLDWSKSCPNPAPSSPLSCAAVSEAHHHASLTRLRISFQSAQCALSSASIPSEETPRIMSRLGIGSLPRPFRAGANKTADDFIDFLSRDKLGLGEAVSPFAHRILMQDATRAA